MGLFATSEDFENVIVGFFNLIAGTPAVAEKLLASQLVIRFIYDEPDVVVLVDCTKDKIRVVSGDKDTQAVVELSMKADIAHKFWFGKVNLTMALARRQMIAKGPVPKILKLLPAIRPTYDMYPQYLVENGYAAYNIH
jgi:hypothetical protein